jgi:hypothetical protein
MSSQVLNESLADIIVHIDLNAKLLSNAAASEQRRLEALKKTEAREALRRSELNQLKDDMEQLRDSEAHARQVAASAQKELQAHVQESQGPLKPKAWLEAQLSKLDTETGEKDTLIRQLRQQATLLL